MSLYFFMYGVTADSGKWLVRLDNIKLRFLIIFLVSGVVFLEPGNEIVSWILCIIVWVLIQSIPAVASKDWGTIHYRPKSASLLTGVKSHLNCTSSDLVRIIRRLSELWPYSLYQTAVIYKPPITIFENHLHVNHAPPHTTLLVVISLMGNIFLQRCNATCGPRKTRHYFFIGRTTELLVADVLPDKSLNEIASIYFSFIHSYLWILIICRSQPYVVNKLSKYTL